MSGDDDVEDDDTTLNSAMLNGTTPGIRADGRSVSTSVHDRSKSTGQQNANGIASSSSTPPQTTHHHHHHGQPKHRSSSHGGAGMGTSPQTTRDTFLNYFFGGGPGANGQPVPTTFNSTPPSTMFASRAGRDTNARDPASQEGGRASPSGLTSMSSTSNAAFDMKSLSKHIEAVSTSILHISWH